VSPAQEMEIKKQIEQMLKADIIQESTSPYSAPVTLAYKRDEGTKTRFCVDYRKLNQITRTDSEPLPLINSVLDRLLQAKYFSNIDMSSGYWHVLISPQDYEKLAFTTTFGLYEWKRLPFGWKNAPSVFQRTIRRILSKHKVSFACNYFDDIIIYSSNFEEHLEHLEKIFQICREENIKLKRTKCKFAQTKINFLGYEVENGTVKPDNPNIEAIKNLKPPTNVKSLQRVLGSINVYARFIDKYANLRKPLNQLLKKDVPWKWTEECQESFDKLKNALITKPVLHLFNPQLPCHVYVDASTEGIGCIIKQPGTDGTLHPIAYHSRTLRPYERNYAITELECLAIIDALDKFYYYLHGKKFTIYTDHAALVWLKNIKHLTGRLFRWSLKLSMFDYEIKYKKGSTNVEADMLSRIPISHHIVHLLDLKEIEEQQKADNLDNKKYKEFNNVLCKEKKGFKKIVVPFPLRLKLLNLAHEQFGHPGIQKMLDIITPIYYWENINQDISKFVKHCNVCQLNKKPKQKRFGLLQSLPPAENPFDLMSIDTVGGLNYYSSTKKYLHIVIDHATRYIWAFPSKSVTTETYINCLRQIFQIQTPKKLLSDRNAAFTSSRFKKFLQHNGVVRLLTTSHHPESNGKLERLNQTIVTRLKCRVNHNPSKLPWTKLLDQVVQEYNNTPHSVTKFPPNYLMFGVKPFPNLINEQDYYPPVEEARKLAFQRTIEHHKKNKLYYDARFVQDNFKVGDKVLYEEFHYPNTRKLSSPFSGPYTIIKQLSPVNYEIDRPNFLTKKDTEIVHVSKLRPYFAPEELRLSHE